MTPAHNCKGAFVAPLGWFVGYSRFLALTTIALLVTAAGSSAQVWKQSNQNPFCKKIYNQTQNPSGSMQASSGAQMACFGPQASGPTRPSFNLPHRLSTLGPANKG